MTIPQTLLIHGTLLKHSFKAALVLIDANKGAITVDDFYIRGGVSTTLIMALLSYFFYLGMVNDWPKKVPWWVQATGGIMGVFTVWLASRAYHAGDLLFEVYGIQAYAEMAWLFLCSLTSVVLAYYKIEENGAKRRDLPHTHTPQPAESLTGGDFADLLTRAPVIMSNVSGTLDEAVAAATSVNDLIGIYQSVAHSNGTGPPATKN